MEKTIIALDVGDKTCGVAGTDALNLTAQPLETLRYTDSRDRKEVFKKLREWITSRNVGTFVVGLPLNMNGTEGPQAAKVREFIAAFKNDIDKFGGDAESLRWAYWDERLSTTGAERSLIDADLSRAKRKKVIDTMAAVFILQGFLETQY